MKKWIVFVCIALLLCGCAYNTDEQVENVRAELADLPVPGDLVRMEPQRQLQVYEHIHELYGQYMTLTPLQRLRIPEAKDVFEEMFAWFQTRDGAMDTEMVSAAVTETVPVTIPEPEPPTVPETEPETVPPTVPETIPETIPETVPETIPETTAPEVVNLTEEEKDLLLRLGMAERGEEECSECIALVMCTVLNRVESGSFGSTVRSVIYAQNQFGPAMDGSLETAEPNDACREALDMVIHGWDESNGALFYEWVSGETWHSRSLKLAAEHCDGQFYKR